jgi:hypothetical protein
MKKVYIFICLFVSTSLLAQVPQEGLKFFNREELEQIIHTIGGTSFQGRGVGQPGYRMAADYIAQNLREWGYQELTPNPNTLVKESGYFQMIPLLKETLKSSFIASSTKSYSLGDQFVPYRTNGVAQLSLEEWVFVGFGIEDAKYTDFDVKTDVRGKGVILWDGEPVQKNGNFVISGNKKPSKWGRIQTKIEMLTKKGVACILVISSNPIVIQAQLNRWKEPRIQLDTTYLEVLKGPQFDVAPEEKQMPVQEMVVTDPMQTPMQTPKSISKPPVFYFSEAAANDIFPTLPWKKLSKAKSSNKINPNVFLSMQVSLSVQKSIDKIEEPNVIGYIPGESGKTVVVSAHLDHLGLHEGKIYPGADDDGSGSSAILLMAKNMIELKKANFPFQHGILFVWFTGEETGLLGSEVFSNVPTIKKENILCNLNVDMIGRNDAIHSGNTDYLYLIGSDRISQRLHEISEQVNERCCQLKLDYTYNDEKDPNRYYYRSDHYNFAEKGIPVIFYFKGVHEDYHKPSDTVEKIELDSFLKAARLVYETTYEIISRSENLPRKTKK